MDYKLLCGAIEVGVLCFIMMRHNKSKLVNTILGIIISMFLSIGIYLFDPMMGIVSFFMSMFVCSLLSDQIDFIFILDILVVSLMVQALSYFVLFRLMDSPQWFGLFPVYFEFYILYYISKRRRYDYLVLGRRKEKQNIITNEKRKI